MSYTILDLGAIRFDTRIIFGGCLVNVNGETFECEVTCNDLKSTRPTYTITYTGPHNEKKAVTFRPYHLSGGPIIFSVEGISDMGGCGTLIVPEHNLKTQDEEDDDDE